MIQSFLPLVKSASVEDRTAAMVEFTELVKAPFKLKTTATLSTVCGKSKASRVPKTHSIESKKFPKNPLCGLSPRT